MLDVKTTHPDVAETLKEFEAYLQIEQPERLLDGKSPWTNIDLTLEQVKKNFSGSEPMTLNLKLALAHYFLILRSFLIWS